MSRSLKAEEAEKVQEENISASIVPSGVSVTVIRPIGSSAAEARRMFEKVLGVVLEALKENGLDYESFVYEIGEEPAICIIDVKMETYV